MDNIEKQEINISYSKGIISAIILISSIIIYNPICSYAINNIYRIFTLNIFIFISTLLHAKYFKKNKKCNIPMALTTFGLCIPSLIMYDKSKFNTSILISFSTGVSTYADAIIPYGYNYHNPYWYYFDMIICTTSYISSLTCIYDSILYIINNINNNKYIYIIVCILLYIIPIIFWIFNRYINENENKNEDKDKTKINNNHMVWHILLIFSNILWYFLDKYMRK